MTNHNHKIDLPSCEFAEQLIAVLYGEASEREKSEFEQHLIQCRSCASEQAAFGSVRNEIIEWRRNDFELLEPKPIQVPVKIAARSNDWTSRLKRWRGILIPQTSFSSGAAAFAGLVICFGLLAFFGYLLANRNSKIEIVDNLTAKQTSPISNNSVSLPPPARPTATPFSDVEENNRRPVLPESVTVKPTTEKSEANLSSSKTVPSAAAPSRRRKSVEKQSVTPVVTPPANNLIIEAADDFEDDSLRLTDLLDDSTFPTSSK